jgi:hypothetical protein
MLQELVSYCEGTSLHGWPHLPGASLVGRVHWLATIIASLAAGVYLSSKLVLYCL